MNVNDYQRLAMRTKCDQIEALYRISNKENHTPGVSLIQLNQAALGLAGDAGELCNAVARCVYYGKELDLTNVKEEVGDVLWWIAEACDAIGVSMEDMMEANIRKLQVRYPDKFTEELAAEENRNREAERQAIETVGTCRGGVCAEGGKHVDSETVLGSDASNFIQNQTRNISGRMLCVYCGGALNAKRCVPVMEGKQQHITCPDCMMQLSSQELRHE